MTNRPLAAIAALAAASLLLAGCAADDTTSNGGAGSTTGATAAGGTIVVGSVNSLSGIATFPEAPQAVQAVFDRYNAAGGLGGRPISYHPVDDKVDPAAASQAARDLVEAQQAVALVGGGSLIECEVNAAYYEEQDIISIPALGIDPSCFTTKNISPVNPGPYIDSELVLTYGSEKLGLQKICAFMATAGSSGPQYEAVLDRWRKATGKELAYVDATVPNGNPDFTPQAVKVREMGCDGVFVNMPEADDLGFLKAAEAQGLTDVTWLLLTSAYSEQFASAAGSATGKGVYILSEFAPFTDLTDPANADWVNLMNEKGIPLTSFSQAGYVAAMNFIEILKSVDGDVTRASVAEAARTMSEIDNPMVGTPYVFGPGQTHNSATAGFPVTLTDGAWAKAGDDWVVLEG